MFMKKKRVIQKNAAQGKKQTSSFINFFVESLQFSYNNSSFLSPPQVRKGQFFAVATVVWGNKLNAFFHPVSQGAMVPSHPFPTVDVPDHAHYTIGVVILVVGITGMVGNFLVIYAFCRYCFYLCVSAFINRLELLAVSHAHHWQHILFLSLIMISSNNSE